MREDGFESTNEFGKILRLIPEGDDDRNEHDEFPPAATLGPDCCGSAPARA
jgi:hypothetical protein